MIACLYFSLCHGFRDYVSFLRPSDPLIHIAQKERCGIGGKRRQEGLMRHGGFSPCSQKHRFASETDDKISSSPTPGRQRELKHTFVFKYNSNYI